MTRAVSVAERRPWDDDENGQTKWCQGPGCRCEDFGRDAGHRMNYEQARGGLAWWVRTNRDDAREPFGMERT